MSAPAAQQLHEELRRAEAAGNVQRLAPLVAGHPGAAAKALRRAARHSSAAAVRLLLFAGAPADAANAEGKTPLMIAAASGSEQVLRLLLTAGADPGATDGGGLTPLIHAAAMGHAACVRLLLQAGAGRPLLEAANREAHQTALIFAANLGHAACVDALLEAGADPNAADANGQAALAHAAAQGRADCVRHLLAGGARVDAADSDGMQAIHFSCRAGAVDCTRDLLAAGASPTARSRFGAAPAILSLAGGHVECIGLLQGPGLPRAAALLPADVVWAPPVPAGDGGSAPSTPLVARFPSSAARAAAARSPDGDAQHPPRPSPGPAAAAAAALPAMVLPAAALPPPAAAASNCSNGVSLAEAVCSELLFPLTHAPFRDPVVAADGRTYERSAFQAWVARQLAEGQPPASPVTGLPLEHGAAVPNRLAAHLVAALQERGLLAAGADADAELEQLLGGLLASPRAPA